MINYLLCGRVLSCLALPCVETLRLVTGQALRLTQEEEEEEEAREADRGEDSEGARSAK